jgi:hypothetical protein
MYVHDHRRKAGRSIWVQEFTKNMKIELIINTKMGASIIQRLELATDRIELEAAIWAGDQICARSSRFPSVIFSKISDKLERK